MKKIYPLLLCWAIFSLGQLQAQLSVLFVDDSTDGFGNAELFHAALDSVGYPADYWNAADSTRGPSDLVMAEYDLVVWHTSSIDNTLYFWNGLDEDNAALEAYLDGGGKLWVVGNDFLFDRYGGAPETFAAGDFPYDYLGLASYDAQSNADDGGLGVPQVEPADPMSPIPGLNNLNWIFSTLFWVDGVSLLEENTAPVYVMAGTGYPLAGSICGSYHDNGTFTVLAYYFDLSLANNFDLIKANVLPVMDHFAGLVSSAETLPPTVRQLQVFPNPSTGPVTLQLELDTPTRLSAALVDAQGRLVHQVLPAQLLPEGQQQLQLQLNPSISNGLYFLRINVDGVIVSRPLMLQH
jgi:hypothetical protein